MVLELYQSDPLKGFLSKYLLHLNLKLAEIQTAMFLCDQCFSNKHYKFCNFHNFCDGEHF